MEVSESKLLQLCHQMSELRFRVPGFDRVISTPWTDTETNPIASNRVNDCCSHLQSEASPLLDRPTPIISPVVARLFNELVDEIAVSAVELDSVTE